MKKYLTVAMFFVLAVALMSPVSASAKTKAGTKSGSFFYFFDTAFEKTNLFFTFSAEKKAKKALENAEERLAEAEESASENKPEAVAEAMENYQENISLAEMEAKAIKDETKTKDLLSTIASSTSKHQEILTEVLAKVPEQAKEAIQKAIEASKKGQEEAMKEIIEPKKEVSEIKQEIEETKNEEETGNKDEQKKEIEKLKKKVETLKQKQPQVKIIEKITEKEKPITIEKKESSSSQTKQNENIVTLPNGAVVEMDASGNIIRTIKEVPQQVYVAPTPPAKSQTPKTIYQISSVPSMKSIAIITNFRGSYFSPFPGNQGHIEYKAIPEGCLLTEVINAGNVEPLCSYDETNYISLGLVIKDDVGKIINNDNVVITTTDSRQNKTIAGTGDVTSMYEDGVKIKTPYYPFNYYFMTPGEHTIKFFVNGMTESVNLEVK